MILSHRFRCIHRAAFPRRLKSGGPLPLFLWNKKWGIGPEIFTPENARAYGVWLGRRYADKPIIWIVGGDRPIENENHLLIVRAMAEGLREGDGSSHLITMHTWGPHATSDFVHDETWLDFHTCQSGHTRDMAKWYYLMVAEGGTEYGHTR